MWYRFKQRIVCSLIHSSLFGFTPSHSLWQISLYSVSMGSNRVSLLFILFIGLHLARTCRRGRILNLNWDKKYLEWNGNHFFSFFRNWIAATRNGARGGEFLDFGDGTIHFRLVKLSIWPEAEWGSGNWVADYLELRFSMWCSPLIIILELGSSDLALEQ